jgi:hypothetical protein
LSVVSTDKVIAFNPSVPGRAGREAVDDGQSIQRRGQLPEIDLAAILGGLNECDLMGIEIPTDML